MERHVSLSPHEAFAFSNLSTNLLEDAIKSNLGPIYNETNTSSQESFIIFLEDFSDYFYNYNDSQITAEVPLEANGDLYEYHFLNCTGDSFALYPDQALNECARNTSYFEGTEIEYNYWALILMIFPFLTLFGNVLVILAVARERTLQTVTNYFIVSLALADLLVAVVVMPFAVYVLFNGTWGLPPFVCDFYIAMDVICSTSSIFNLVAISIDRYIAVTQPIKYAKHKNNRRVWLTILLVWAISSAIGSPIVLGLNNTPDRLPDLCLFYNSDFIIYSSLSSFYIPCIIMVFLYYNIFKALRLRALKHRATKRPHYSDLTTATVVENVSQTRKLAETVLGPLNAAEERPTNTASGSNEEDDDQLERSSDVDDCHIIVTEKNAEFILATVVEEAGSVVTKLATPSVADANGNNDSGYAPSGVEYVLNKAPVSLPGSPARRVQLPSTTENVSHARASVKKNGLKQELRHSSRGHSSAERTGSMERKASAKSISGSKKERKSSAASKFTIYKVNKASRKKREKNSAKKERKATKTLAIVLGVFLVCWVPFFTCNIMDATCTKLNLDCQPGVTAFILTTWLGYMNSFVNPVIYTIFNPEFRKAFKKLMNIGT